MNSELSRRSTQLHTPARPDGFVLLFVAWLAILITACQTPPTPTLVPIPTATYIPTETATAPAPSPSPTLGPMRAVVTDTLRVRAEPNTTSMILGRLKANTAVELLARNDDNLWYVIEYPPDSGDHGWISSAIVVPDGPADQLPVGYTAPPPPGYFIYANVKHLLNVRQGPSKDYDSIATFRAGARITLVGRSEDGKWYQTFYPPESRKKAWVLGDEGLLELLGETEPLKLVAAPPTPTPAPTPIPRPTRTPGGPAGTGRILMSSNRAGAYDIYSIAENGAIRKRLTSFGESFGARFSPDGNRIVFYHTVATSPYVAHHIYVMNADGAGLRDLSSSAAGASDSDPDWSPDGKRIAFVRTVRAGGPEIWTMNVDGTGARRVVALSIATGISTMSVGDFSIQPRWSPDGGRIAYAAVPRTQNPGAPLYPNIFMVNADGSGETQLTDNDLINANPVWSPDGKQIAWSAKDFINRQNWRVWVMSAGGGNQRLAISQLQGDGNNGIQIAEWAGNRWLLSGWNGNWNVFLGNSDGSKVAPATSENADNRPTDWLP